IGGGHEHMGSFSMLAGRLVKAPLIAPYRARSGPWAGPFGAKIARTIQLAPTDCKDNPARQKQGDFAEETPEMTEQSLADIAASLARIAQSLEAMGAPSSPAGPALGDADAYHWEASGRLLPVPRVARVPLDMLKGIDDVRDILLQNTLQFARGFAANNALLWGARGMGKSSLVKALHGHVAGLGEPREKRLILVEIAREDIESLPRLMRIIAGED